MKRASLPLLSIVWITCAALACSSDPAPGGGGADSASSSDAAGDAGGDVAADAGGGGDAGGADAGGSDGGGGTDAVDDAVGSDAGGSDAGGSDAGGSDAGGLDAGGSDAGGADAGADAGGGFKPGCCKSGADCGQGGDCVMASGGAQGKCKDTGELKAGQCWSDAQCGGGSCVGASVCPCGASCLVPDKPGTCGSGGGAACSINPIGVNLPCTKSDEYCKLNSGCEGKGVCTPKPTACLGVVDEHCGCDGKTYSNACEAAADGRNVASKGACKPSGGGSCTKVDPNSYGACDMLLGYGWEGSKCVAVSGCGCGSDCDKLFKTKAACDKACAKNP